MSALTSMKHCYVIQRKINGQVWTTAQDNKRTVIAFREEQKAKMFLQMFNSVEDVRGHARRVIVQKTNVSSLFRRCSLNYLHLSIMDVDGSFIELPCFDKPNDDIVFHFENSLRYY
jgi:hypothetical protein